MFFASSIFRHKTRFCSGSINSLKLFLCLLRSGLNSTNKSSQRPRWHPEIRTKAVVIQLQLMAQTMKFLPAPAFSWEPSISVSSFSLTIRTSSSSLHVSFFSHCVFRANFHKNTACLVCIYTLHDNHSEVAKPVPYRTWTFDITVKNSIQHYFPPVHFH